MEDQDYQRPNPLDDTFMVEEFSEEFHLGLLVSWLKARDIGDETTKNLPGVGFIVFESQRPIAIGFLRQAEGHIGICEGFCTNPEIEPSTRNAAADVMVERLIEAGRELHLTVLLAWTKDSNTLERSLRHGFVNSQSTLISYDLLQTSELH